MLEKRHRDITQKATGPEAYDLVRRIDGDSIHLSYVYH
jgi:hypothetical protein